MNIPQDPREADISADIIIESHQGGLFDHVHESLGATRALQRVLSGAGPHQ